MSDVLISRIAKIELVLAALVVALFTIIFGIRETDDAWALVLSFAVLAFFPILVLLTPAMSAFAGKLLKTLALAAWPFILFWLVVYA